MRAPIIFRNSVVPLLLIATPAAAQQEVTVGSCIVPGVTSWQVDTEKKEIFRLCASGHKQQITCRQMQRDLDTLDRMIEKLERVIKGEWPMAFFFNHDAVMGDPYAYAIPPERHQEMLETFKQRRKSIIEADRAMGSNAPLYGCPAVS